LLQDPFAVAVTQPGVVLVLEAGASQLSAFGLSGNPLRYFLPTGPLSLGLRGQRRRRGVGVAGLQFKRPLVSPGTYLDLAVDGAGQMYLLYYTGDGSQPQNYHIDVYTMRGVPLATHSPGVNVPHLAVDFWRSVYAANYDPLVIEGT